MPDRLRNFVPAWALAVLAVFILAACGGESSSEEPAERSVSVATARAETRDVRAELHSIGRLISRNAPLLASEINARVTEVLVDEGLAVEAGQVLVRLDTTTAALAEKEARADIQRLKASIGNEERRVARYRDLRSRGVMPEERLDDAEAKLSVDRASLVAAEARLAIAHDRLDKAELKTPVSGVVERRHVSVGDYVKVGGPVMSVTDTQALRAELPFPETVGHLLRPGQRLIVESPVAPGVVLETVINQIRPEVGVMSRALVVLADVRNPGPWRPEATIEATVVVDDRPGAVVVPVVSVVERPAGQVVYVLDGEKSGQVRQQTVETGRRLDGWVEIRSGLEAGALVVSEGAHYLSDGARVTEQQDQP
jgi:RND family efflux transporter MFP subunit